MSKLQELLKKSYNKYGDNEFISYIEEDKKITKTFKETIYDVLSLSEFLISKKLLDKNILIVGKNSYEWLISWTSIISYVGVAIPINNLWTSSNI